jgi:hypothetical protein
MDGRFEQAENGMAVGWVWDQDQPDTAIDVRVLVDGVEVASGPANLSDSSLAEAGIGDGAHMFRVALPAELADGGEHEIEVLAGDFAVPPLSGFSGAGEDSSSRWGSTRFIPRGPAPAPPEASSLEAVAAAPGVTVRASETGHEFRGDLSSLRLEALTIEIDGTGCVISLGRDVALEGCKILVEGTDCRIEVGDGSRLRATTLRIRGDRGEIKVGSRTTMEGGHLLVHENDQAIICGRDCMFSREIFVRTSDSHPILDLETGERVNPPRAVVLGDHVWVGAGAQIGKGVQIGSGAVIGQRAIVTTEVPKNAVVGGSPARVIRAGVVWQRALP